MEIFVFVRMGGNMERIITKSLEIDQDSEDRLFVSLRSFDAGKAMCFVDADRHHLLSVLEAS